MKILIVVPKQIQATLQKNIGGNPDIYGLNIDGNVDMIKVYKFEGDVEIEVREERPSKGGGENASSSNSK